MTNILVVEDESIVAKDLQLTLTRLGYGVPATASSSEDAMSKARLHRPDLVLMDIHIQGAVDGITTAQLLRQELNIPVIYLTAYADDDTVARARETEPFGYLLKPFNERELRSTLEVAIYKHHAEARLRHDDRMISIGTMAAGVAHEINNPLSFVLTNLDFVARALTEISAELGQPPRGEDTMGSLAKHLRGAASAVEDATIGADRVRKVVADMGKFARADEPKRSPIDLWETLDTALRMSAHRVQHNATIVREPGVIPRVLATQLGLEQVFINLLVNAAQAMPEGQPRTNRLRVATRTDENGHAVVEIADTGAGISPGVRARIFDPFFTTKPVGFGTGLGLSICHRIITDFGGTIGVESELGQGSVFRITLPPAEMPTPVAVAPPAPPRDAVTPRAQILVVDDEARVLTMLDRVLSRRHDVSLASDGAEALALITAGRRFDLVLCDLMMPHMTGMELYARVEQLAPEQAAAFMFLSGGAVTQSGADFLEKHADRRFDKPFQLRDLEAMIAAKLAEAE